GGGKCRDGSGRAGKAISRRWTTPSGPRNSKSSSASWGTSPTLWRHHATRPEGRWLEPVRLRAPNRLPQLPGQGKKPAGRDEKRTYKLTLRNGDGPHDTGATVSGRSRPCPVGLRRAGNTRVGPAARQRPKAARFRQVGGRPPLRGHGQSAAAT